MMRCLLFVVIFIALSLAANLTVTNSGLEAQSAAVASRTCLPDAIVSDAVRKFSSSLKDPELAQVKKVLLGNAERSQKCRKQVIGQLMKAMDKPNLDFLSDRASLSYWVYGAELLGNLKATESLDLLIAHVNSTDGLSPNMNHYPAVRGIITMGPIAVPKLAAALRNHSDPSFRIYVVFCIASIGGNSAKSALKQALDFESDGCNRNFIEASLRAFNNKRTPNRIIFDPERSKWYAAFDCGGK